MKDKIQLVAIPSLLVHLGLLVGYTFLHWLLLIRLELFAMEEMISHFVLPMVLAAAAAIFIIRPRLKILQMETTSGNWLDFHTFIMVVVLLLPLVIAQHYVVSASGKLTSLQTIDEIAIKEKTKYYSLSQFYIDKKRTGIHTSFDTSGKNEEDFNMHIYAALPIFVQAADTLNNECTAWLGIEYKETINNNLEPDLKEKRFKIFAERSQWKYDHADFSKFVYLERVGPSAKLTGFKKSIGKNEWVKGDPIVLLPINESFESRNGSMLEWLVGSTLFGLALWLYMVLRRKVDEEALARITSGRPDEEAKKEWLEFFSVLKPREGYFFTPILVNVNVLIFLVLVVFGFGFLSFSAEDLVKVGANYGPLTKDGQWWRLFTCMFLHGGFMHVFANCIGLLFVGTFLEPVLGKAKFVLVYIATGLIASAVSLWWHDATVSVGASGAIFGLYGLFISFLITKVYHPEFSKAFLASTVVYIGFNLLMGMVGAIDNAAHLGGLVSGFVVGLLLSLTIKKSSPDGTDHQA